MTSAETRFNKSLRPRKPEGSLGRIAQDVHLDSHTAPELWSFQTRTTGIYRSMLSKWRRQSKSTGLWQYQTFRHGPILYWTGRWRYAQETLLFFSCFLSFFFFFFFFFLSLSLLFRVLRSFWQGHMRCVRLEWLTDWIGCERSLFTLCSWLRRRNAKISSVASAASLVPLHGLPEADHRIQNQK